MPSDEPDSTWHPAFMPNSAQDLPPKPTSHNASDSAAAPSRAVELASSPVAREESVDATDDMLAEDEEEAAQPAADPWFAEESGEDWLAGNADDAESSPTDENRHPDPSEDHAEDALPTIASPVSTSTKHHSVVSFARTSHEVDWDAEEEDPEWNLPRTNTDPFKFMPLNDRTNSFPVVPQLQERSVYQPYGEPSPTKSVAESFSHLTPVAPKTSFADDDVEASGPHELLGGDHQAPEVEASEARFEEGLPLIAQEQEAPAAQENDASSPGGLFSGESAPDDDFFDQVGGSGQDDSAAPPVQMPPLERKSTMQVLSAFGRDPLDRADTGLEDMLEESQEDDDFWGKQQPDGNAEVHDFSLQGADEVDGAAEPAQTTTAVPGQEQQESGDLAAQWAAVLGEEDEDVLLDEEAPPASAVDPAAFFEDDGEGFLDDDEDAAQPPAPVVAAATAPAAQSPGLNGRYAPTGALPTPTSVAPLPTPRSQYMPSPTPFATQHAPLPPAVTPFASQPTYGAVPPRPEPVKAASFVDKSKGGYTSPYDLPLDMKPKKRQSTQQLYRPAENPTPPGSSHGQVPPPVSRTASSVTAPPPTSVPVARPAPPQQSSSMPPTAPAKPPQRTQSGFFEELPMSARVRPASRTSHQGLNSPTATGPPTGFGGPPQPSPNAAPQGPQHVPQYPGQPPMSAPPSQPFPQQMGPESHASVPTAAAGGLVAPPRVSPYAPLQSGSVPQPSVVPAAANSRYSPAGQLSTSAPPATVSRYSPAPPAARSSGPAYAPVQHPAVPPMLPHQPRTSSPLAHFESASRPTSSSANQPDGVHHERLDRRSNSAMYGLQRVPSLPPTRETEEEAQYAPPSSSHSSHSHTGRPTSQGHPQIPSRARQTPPPAALTLVRSTLSPPKRVSSYTPQQPPQPQQSLSPPGPEFAPPPRSHTQSPGALYGRGSAEPIPRPSSVHDPTSPRSATSAAYAPLTMPVSTAAPTSRPRGFSQNFNLVPPTDGTEHDPLQRWRGAPVMAWGVGGTFVTSFPRDTPRYGMSSSVPSIVRSPGEIKVKHIKDAYPLEDRLSKFPGPLKGSKKKKETVAWLSAGIEELERALPDLSFQAHFLLEDKRAVERVLLWKILKTFIEFDGTLEGSAEVEKAVRAILSPAVDLQSAAPVAPAVYGYDPDAAAGSALQSDSVDSATVEQIQRNLLAGERETAVWDAVNKRLWGHALLIANTVSPDLYKKVTSEFVKKEVNYAGHKNEPLAVLYGVLSGNHDECVNELVPAHARAGVQLMEVGASISHSAPSADPLSTLDKWTETLGLILSNRSTGDVNAINKLGSLLAGYGRAEAAHVCFLFARNSDDTVFGGLYDPKSSFVLVGADHRTQADQFGKDVEAWLLSEVFEYGMSLPAGASSSSRDLGSPHLAGYKLLHAMVLAEHGFRDKALQYCEALHSAITAQTRRSPYHHAALEAEVHDLMMRLRQAPREESNSWISKPNMGKVSSTFGSMFNKFVTGDENEKGVNGSADGAVESGPFARLAGGTPTISRPPSAGAGIATGMEMFGGVAGANSAFGPHGYPVPSAPVMAPAPATRAASRYAPGNAQPVANSYEPAQSSYAPRASPSTGRSSGEYSRGSPELSRRSTEMNRSAYLPAAPVAASNGLPSPGHSPALPRVPSMESYSPYAPQAIHGDNELAAPVVDNSASVPAYGYQPHTMYSNGSPYGAPTMHNSTMAGEEQVKDSAADTDSPASASMGYQPYGFEPPAMTPYEPSSTEKSDAADDAAPATSGFEPPSYGGYEAPSFQPYSYDPPSPQPDAEDSFNGEAAGGDKHSEFSGHSFMDNGALSDVPPAANTTNLADKTKADKDRENAEMFRKAAEEDAKRAEADKAAKAKKGWFGGGWFGGGGGAAKKEDLQPKAVRAKLGEQNSFHYDPELKRWVNKKAGAEAVTAGPTGTPPPPTSVPRSSSATPPPPSSLGMAGRASAPPPRLTASASMHNLAGAAASQPSLALPPGGGGLPTMSRSFSSTSAGGELPGGPPSAPPSRPTTSMSNDSSVQDVYNAAAVGRKPGAKKARKSGRYIDVMAK